MELQLLIVGIFAGPTDFATSLARGSQGQVDRCLQLLAVFAALEFGARLRGLALGQSVSGQPAEHAAWLGSRLVAGPGLWTNGRFDPQIA